MYVTVLGTSVLSSLEQSCHLTSGCGVVAGDFVWLDSLYLKCVILMKVILAYLVDCNSFNGSLSSFLMKEGR